MKLRQMESIPHPLLLPGIIEDVFERLSTAQVKLCRSVCKTWNVEGSTILRKRKCVVYLVNSARLKSFIQNKDQKGNISVKIGSDFGKKHPIIHTFFKKFGKSIVSLELCHPSWTSFVSLRKFLAQNVPNIESLCLHLVPPENGYGHIPTWNSDNPAHELYTMKKLTTLRFSIEYSNYWTFAEQESMKPFLRHLLSGMPNLETISCPKYPENFIETFQYEVQILFRESPNLRPLISLLMEPKGPKLTKLKHLDMPLKHWTNINQLQERNYPLERLDWFIGLDVTGQEIHNFLTQVSKTMKFLSMDFTTAGKFLRDVNYEPCNSFQCLQNFDRLESLSLRSFKGSLKIILGIPSLKNLTLTKARNLDVAFDEANFPNTVKYDSIVSLVIDQHNPKDAVDENTLDKIGQIFPNLVKFEIRFLSDEALRGVFKSFPKLEELVAMDGIFHDEGVTGICPQKMEAARRNKLEVPTKQLGQFRTHPYIADLKNLKKLSLGSKHLTGNSAYFGIVDCHNLTSLTLMGYGFSSQSLCAIGDKLNLSFFKTIFCGKLLMEGYEHIQKRMPYTELQLNRLQPPLNGLDIYRLGLFQSGTAPVRKRSSVSLVSPSSASASSSSAPPSSTAAPPPTEEVVPKRRRRSCRKK